MASGTIDFRSPAAGFDQPLQMWLACHERVQRMCSLLLRLHEHIREKGVDPAAGVTAHSILRYFNEAAPNHHEDEEKDLFPRLLVSPGRRGRAAVTSAIARLQAEHATLDAQWADTRPQLEAIERGEASRLNADAVRAFENDYRQHISLEETVLGPAMQRSFDAATWRDIGKSMAERRGVSWHSLHAP